MDILSDVNISGNLNLGSSDGSIMKFVDNVHSSGYCGNIIFKFDTKDPSVPTLFVSKDGGENTSSPGQIRMSEFILHVDDLWFRGKSFLNSTSYTFSNLKNFQSESLIHSDRIIIPANVSEFYYEGEKFDFFSKIPRVEFFENNKIELEDGCGNRVTEVIYKRVEIDYGFYMRECDSYQGRLMLRPTPSDVERKIILVYQCGQYSPILS